MKTWRSWPWTIALAGVLAGFVLLGLVGLGLRTSLAELVISAVVTLAALAALLRVLSMGVRATPTGLIIRDLTRTRPVLWTQIRKVTCEPTDRRGVHAPVLHLTSRRSTDRKAGGGKAADGKGTATATDIEVTVLASYQRAVAQRRTDLIEAARVAATRRTR